MKPDAHFQEADMPYIVGTLECGGMLAHWQHFSQTITFKNSSQKSINLDI